MIQPTSKGEMDWDRREVICEWIKVSKTVEMRECGRKEERKVVNRVIESLSIVATVIERERG